MHTLDPRQTSCFLTAIQCGTVRGAAEQLALEPSTVSRNISALEKRLATTLVERGRLGVRATEAGELLIAFLSQQEGALDLLQSEFDALAGMKRGKVSIAVGEGFVGDLFDNALAAFLMAFPDITFSLSVGSTENVLHQVVSEQAHIGLAYNVPKAPQIRVQTSCAQPLVGLVKRGGFYDTEQPFSLDDLAAMPCAVPPKSFGIGAMITAAEARQGVRLRAVIETGSIAALKAFVRNDMGCTILPRFVVESELSAGLMVARSIPRSIFPDGQSSLIRKEGRKLPQAAQLLLKHLKSMSAFT
ncbi:LysR family transcriptional regulator [Aestuariibius sp. HNIBRBA575]|uniref:LysR family transcriptional regulator n=1 Tax=Aestuariibius sp. HNIBRBA575 TaxID=3233343 RepID=UPI0034A30DD3